MSDFYEKNIILENERVKLTPFQEDYADDLRKIIFDKEITKYSGNHFTSNRHVEDYISKTIQARKDQHAYPFIIIDKPTGQVAGSTRFGNINFQAKRLEIGWTWYGASFRGSGINKAAKFELLKYAFEVMEFNRVQFSVDSENARSQKAVMKLGATREGLFRSNYVNAIGQVRDDIYFSIIRTEWMELKATVFGDLKED